MWTFPASGDAAACIALQLGLLESLIDQGVTERELSFAKRYLTKGYAFEIDTASKRLGQRLDEVVIPLPKDYHTRYLERVQAVTRDEVNTALRKRISSSDLLITIVATASELRSALDRVIPDLVETRVVRFDQDTIEG